jgi:ATP-dependent exoDNAse (exonuclease V) beta subunit
MAQTKLERNYRNNANMVDDVIHVFRKTENIERLVTYLAHYLDNGQFRYLFATEFATIPLNVVFVDNNNQTSDNTETSLEGANN